MAEKGAATFPTAALELVIITSVIDALEMRDAAINNILGAFLNGNMEELVHMKLEGRLTKLMAMIVTEVHMPYITIGKNGKAVLNVILQKAP